MEYVVEMLNIRKEFPGIVANDNITLQLKEGEIHALLGENGAGKSTLAKVILGAYKAEEGEITFDNEVVKFNGTKDALAKGIVAVYQEFTLVPYITVAQNIFLNREYKNKFGLIDHKRMEKEAAELLKSLNCEYINVKSYVKNLSVAEQQMVEIAKAVSKNASILVFDEPSAALSDSETEFLFKMIRQLKEEGVSMVYISHRMNEILEICDRVTVIRDGKKVITEKVENLTM